MWKNLEMYTIFSFIYNNLEPFLHRFALESPNFQPAWTMTTKLWNFLHYVTFPAKSRTALVFDLILPLKIWPGQIFILRTETLSLRPKFAIFLAKLLQFSADFHQKMSENLAWSDFQARKWCDSTRIQWNISCDTRKLRQMRWKFARGRFSPRLLRIYVQFYFSFSLFHCFLRLSPQYNNLVKNPHIYALRKIIFSTCAMTTKIMGMKTREICLRRC